MWLNVAVVASFFAFATCHNSRHNNIYIGRINGGRFALHIHYFIALAPLFFCCAVGKWVFLFIKVRLDCINYVSSTLPTPKRSRKKNEMITFKMLQLVNCSFGSNLHHLKRGFIILLCWKLSNCTIQRRFTAMYGVLFSCRTSSIHRADCTNQYIAMNATISDGGRILDCCAGVLMVAMVKCYT